MVQCLLWNLETDVVTPGQWLKGRIYEHRCDVSPNGELFVYFAANHKGEKWDEGSWTAISRPPYLTALALWFKGDCWDGGGLFDGNNCIRVNGLGDHRYDPKLDKPPLKVASLGGRGGEDWPIEHERRARDGWRLVQEIKTDFSWLRLSKGYTTHVPRVMSKEVDSIKVTETYHLRRFEDIRSFTAQVGDVELDLTGANQVDIDAPRSRVIYTVGGKILVSDGASTKQIADLTENKFHALPPAKWTTEWP